MRFTEFEYGVIVRALRIAAKQYEKDAEVYRLTHYRIACDFDDSKTIAVKLAIRIETEEGV